MCEEIAAFTEKNSEWLPEYALFMALKEEKYRHMPVYMWPDKDVRDRKPAALEQVTAELRDEVDFRIFLQYIFFKQWTALREYANEKGIQIIGDIPIYVSADSRCVSETGVAACTSQPLRRTGCADRPGLRAWEGRLRLSVCGAEAGSRSSRIAASVVFGVMISAISHNSRIRVHISDV